MSHTLGSIWILIHAFQYIRTKTISYDVMTWKDFEHHRSFLSEINLYPVFPVDSSHKRRSSGELWCFYGYWLINTHLPLVPHICVSVTGQHRLRQWPVAYSATSHYLNQCWDIVNCTRMNKLHGNSNQNTKLFIHENGSDNTVCEMAAISSRERWVNLN